MSVSAAEPPNAYLRLFLFHRRLARPITPVNISSSALDHDDRKSLNAIYRFTGGLTIIIYRTRLSESEVLSPYKNFGFRESGHRSFK